MSHEETKGGRKGGRGGEEMGVRGRKIRGKVGEGRGGGKESENVTADASPRKQSNDITT